MNYDFNDLLFQLKAGEIAHCWLFDKDSNRVTLLFNDDLEYELINGEGKGQTIETFNAETEEELLIDYLENM